MPNKKIIRTKTGFRVTHINRRRACRLMCTECMGWDEKEVDLCDGKMLDGKICSLVNFKKMREPQNAKERFAAIKTFCLNCMGDNIYLVTHCTSTFCPLYPYRQTVTDKSTLHDMDIPDETVLQLV